MSRFDADKLTNAHSLPTFLLGNTQEESQRGGRWRRSSQAVVMSMLPSRQTYHSITGLVLGRDLMDLSRRKNEVLRRKSIGHGLTGAQVSEIRRRRTRAASMVDGIDDELELWQRRQSVKNMTASLDTKRMVRDEIISKSVKQLPGISSWQHKKNQTWRRMKQRLKSWIYLLEPWAGQLKIIEGKLGVAVMAYFRFVRWLMFLNLYMSVILLSLTLVPYLVLHNQPPTFELSIMNISSGGLENHSLALKAVDCTKNYLEYLQNETQSGVFNQVIDVLQGTGWLEHTVLFFGVYYNKTFYDIVDQKEKTYPMDLCYLLGTGGAFLISFLLINKNSAKGVREGSVGSQSGIMPYCNKVFVSWDYCMTKETAAETKHKNIANEIKKDLEEQRRKRLEAKRTTLDKFKLYSLRLFINIIVIVLLIGALVAVYFSFTYLLQLEQDIPDLHPLLQVIIQYLPSLTITLLNVIVPIFFKKLVLLENYSPSREMQMTLLRTIVLRLVSLGVLIISLYQLLEDSEDSLLEDCGNKRWQFKSVNITGNGTAATATIIKCWETYIGQQIYKLVVLDFLVGVVVVFVVEFPRRFIVKTFNLKLFEMIGLPEIDLPKIVLDIVYSQTLCWMGLFFSPLIPLICFFKCFFTFYIKKMTLMNNYIPPVRPYRTSRSNSLFIGMLTISFLLAALPMTYMIGKFHPSQSCGPFRVYSRKDGVFFDVISTLVQTWPYTVRVIIQYLGTMYILGPAIFICCLLIFYFWTLKGGYIEMEKHLQEKLKLESHDKQFLLARVNEVLKHVDSLSE